MEQGLCDPHDLPPPSNPPPDDPTPDNPSPDPVGPTNPGMDDCGLIAGALMVETTTEVHEDGVHQIVTSFFPTACSGPLVVSVTDTLLSANSTVDQEPLLPQVSVSDATVLADGCTLEFTVDMSEPSDHDVTVDYRTPDGLADGVATILQGTTQTTVVLSTCTGQAEDVHLILSGISDNAQIADDEGQGIVPDDGSPADILINDFYTDGVNLLVDYTVLNQAAGAFHIGIYASADGETLPGAPLQLGDGNTAIGQHLLVMAPTFNDLTDDYFLVAKVDSGNDLAENSEDNNTALFDGGSFLVHELSGKSVIHVQGTSLADWVSLLGDGDGVNVSIERKLSSAENSNSPPYYPDVTGDNRAGQLDAAAVTFNQTHAQRLWQNPADRFDVNADAMVDTNDVVLIADALTSTGTRLLSDLPDPTGAATLYDVNGDNVLSVLDLQQLIEHLDPVGANGGNSPWQNPTDPFDVNGDGYVAPIDALIVIDALNSALPPDLSADPDPLSFYYDVSGDHALTYLDVLELFLALDVSKGGNIGGMFSSTAPLRNSSEPGDVNADGLVNDVDISAIMDLLPRGYGLIHHYALASFAEIHVRAHEGDDTVAASLGGLAVGLWVFGGSGNDRLSGSSGNDWIHGGPGNDQLAGGDGEDSLLGEEGNDVILGGESGDVVYGDEGADLLLGEDGNDLIHSDAADPLTARIADWTGLENTGDAEFVVTLSRPAVQPIHIEYHTQALGLGSVAIAGSDFTSTSGVLTIPQGATQGTISVPIQDDSEEENAETFRVILGYPISAGLVLDRLGAIGTIRDDDGPRVTVDDVSASEGQPLLFAVNLSPPSLFPITVTYSLGGTVRAADFSDYPTQQVGSLTFAPGETTKTITLHPIDDARDENDETVIVTIRSMTTGVIMDEAATGTVLDVNPTPVLNISSSTVDEGNGGAAARQATFTATLSAASNFPIDVPFHTADGAASGGADPLSGDYLVTGGTLHFAPGETSKTIAVPICGDSLDEGDENFFVNLTVPDHVLSGTLAGEETILDDDGPNVVVSDPSVDEGGNLVFVITLSAQSPQAIAVQYRTSNGTAQAGAQLDYGALGAATAMFAPGDTTQQITVSTRVDGLNENPETVRLELLGATQATIAKNVGIGTIIDHDPQPTLSIDDAAASERDRQAMITVRLGAISGRDATVQYTTAADSGATTAAAAGDDYTVQQGTIVIPAGQTSASVAVGVANDLVLEPDETFSVVLQQADGAMLARSAAVVAIHDDTPPPKISIDRVFGAVEGGPAGSVVLHRTGDPSAPVAVNYRISMLDSTATPGVDYDYLDGTTPAAPLVGTITFPAGQPTVAIMVQPIADGIAESPETLRIVLVAGQSYEIDNPASASIAIRDVIASDLPHVALGRIENEVQQVVLPDPTGGTWSLSLGSAPTATLAANATASQVQSALEALTAIGPGNVTVTGAGTPADPFAIVFQGALAGLHVGALTLNTDSLTGKATPAVQVASGSSDAAGTSARFEIRVRPPNENAALVADGNLRVYWGASSAGGFGGGDPSASGPIDLGDLAAAYAELAAAQDAAAIAAASAHTAAAKSAIEAALNAIENIVSAGGTITIENIEFSESEWKFDLEFGGGLANQDISSPIVLNNVMGGTSQQPVRDQDGNPAQVSVAMVQQGSRGKGGGAQTIALAHAADGSFRLTFKGQTTAPLAWNSSAEMVQQALCALPSIGIGNVAVSGPDGGPWSVEFQRLLGTGEQPFLAADSSGLLSAAARTVIQGGPAADAAQDAVEGGHDGYVRVYRDAPSSNPLTVRYTIASSVGASGSATPGIDFQSLPGSVMIPAGALSADLLIQPIDDGLVEGAESFTITLSDPLSIISTEPTYLVDTPSRWTASIVDDDFAGPRPSISLVKDQDASEPATDGHFHVALSEAASAPVIVSYSIDPSSTAAASDYQPLSGSVTVPAGATTADIAVMPIDDHRYEGNETLTLTLIGADDRRYVLAATHSANMTIADNDPAPDLSHPVVTIEPLGVDNQSTEPDPSGSGGQAGTFVLTRTGNLAAPLSVDFTINDYSAAHLAQLGADFTYTAGSDTTALVADHGSVTFPANAATVAITIDPVHDELVEGDEAVYLKLSASPTNAYSLGPEPSAHLAIQDGACGATTGVLVFVNSVTTDEIQRVVLAGPPTGGTFTLSFEGQTTGPIAYNAPVAVVQAALESLSTIGAGHVTVTRNAPSDWSVEFHGGYVYGDVPLLTGNGVALTGAVKVTGTTLTPAAPGVHEVQKIWTYPSSEAQGGGYSYRLFQPSRLDSSYSTGWIAWNAAPSEVKAALQSYASHYGSAIDTVTRSGNATSGYHYTITWSTFADEPGLSLFQDEGSMVSPLMDFYSNYLWHTSVSTGYVVDGSSTPIGEVQRLTFSRAATGGAFTLAFAGQTTDAIAYNAPWNIVQARLQALQNVGPNNVLVTGNAGGTLSVTFSGSLAGIDAPQITANTTGLAGGSFSISTTQPPSTRNEIQRVTLPGPPKGGTFTLAFQGRTSYPISYNASPAELAADLEPVVGDPADVTVTKLGTSSWSIEFQRAWSGSGVPLLVGDGSGLTGDATATVDTLVAGVPGPSEIQRLDIGYFGAGPNYLTFTLRYPGSLVPWKLFDLVSPPTGAELQSYLEAQAGAGNVAVTELGPSGTFKQSYKIAFTGALAHRAVSRFSLELTMPSTTNGVSLSELSVGSAGGTSAVQRITLGNNPTGGTFSLTYDGKTTADISATASALDVQNALAALLNIGSSTAGPNVAVTGNDGGPYTVTFQHALASTIVSPIMANAAGLTGGPVTAAVTRQALGINRTQLIHYYNGPPIGGSFRLSFQGDQTGPISFNAPAAAVQAKLEALPEIGAGNITVAGDAGGPYTVTFGSQFAGALFVQQLVADSSGLRDGTCATQPVGPRVISLEPKNDPAATSTTVTGTVTVSQNTTSLHVDYAYINENGDLVDAGQQTVADFTIQYAFPDIVFDYDPAAASGDFGQPGHKELLYRVTAYHNEEQIGQTTWNRLSFDVADTHADGSLRLQNMHLVKPVDPNNPAETLPAAPLLEGIVAGDLDQGSASLEIDLDPADPANPTISVPVSDDRAFSYDVGQALGGRPGTYTIKLRAVVTGGSVAIDPTEWQTVDVLLDDLPDFSDLWIDELHAENQQYDPTAMPLLVGHVAVPASASPAGGNLPANPSAAPDKLGTASVEVEVTANSQVDHVVIPIGRAVTDQDGDFSISLGRLAAGDYTIEARAIERSQRYASEINGPPTVLNVSLAPLPAPAISALSVDDMDLGPLTVLGPAFPAAELSLSDDGATINGSLTAQQGGENVAGIDVQFLDGVSKKQLITVFGASGTFTLSFDGVSTSPLAFNAAADAIASALNSLSTIQSANSSVTVTKAGQVFTVLFSGDLPNHDVPLLVADASPTLTVYIDEGFDALATAASDGTFQLNPLVLGLGAHTLRARAAVWDENLRRTTYSPWSADDGTVAILDFTAEPPANQPPVVAGLAHPVATDPQMTGQLTNDGSVSFLTVELDVDGHGAPYSTTTTDASGNFVFVPVGLVDGAHTIVARGVEWDPVARQHTRGDWQSLTFQLLSPSQANILPAISNFKLLSPTGTTNNNITTTANATVAGTVTVGGVPAANLTVEIDQDGDGTADGVAVADSRGNFRFQPAGLSYDDAGNASDVTVVRARAIEFDEATQTYVGRNNWNDTGAAITFRYRPPTPGGAAPMLVAGTLQTADPLPGADPTRHSLEGQVASEGALANITVVLDFNGDGVADQTTTTDENGRWSIQPQGLATTSSSSSATIQVQTISTDPATHHVFASNWQPQTIQYPAIAQTISQAAQTRNGAINSAQSTYNQALTTANSNYLAAIGGAASTLDADLQSAYPNPADRVSYDFQQLAWPDAPPDNRLQVPDDGSQPVPPLALPQYAGPAFDWQSDLGYLMSVSMAAVAKNQAIQAANDDFNVAKKTAEDDYNSGVRQADDDYRQKMDQAEQAYRNDQAGANNQLNGNSSQANQAYDSAARSAWSDYTSAVNGNYSVYKSLRRSAQQTLNGVIAAADRTYQSDVDQAWQDYVSGEPYANDAATRVAYVTYAQKVFDATNTRDKADAGGRRQYDNSVNSAVKNLTKNNADAWKLYQEQLNKANNGRGKATATNGHQYGDDLNAAQQKYEKAKNDADRDLTKAIADAAQTRDDDIAGAQFTRDDAIAQATADEWTAEIDARASAYQAWSDGSLWCSYQLALVQHEQTYVQAKAAAYVQEVHQDNQAAYDSATESDDAVHDRTWADAEAKWKLTDDILKADDQRSSDSGGHTQTHANDAADDQQRHDDDDAKAGNDYAKKAADLWYTYADKISLAEQTADKAIVDARQFQTIGQPGDDDYSYHEFTDANDQIDIEAQREHDRNDAWQEYQLGLIDAAQTYDKALLDFDFDLANKRADNGKASGDDHSADDAARDHLVAQANCDYAIAIATDLSQQEQRTANAEGTRGGAVAGNDEQFAQADAGFRHTQQLSDAASQQTFTQTAADNFVSAISTWKSSYSGTPQAPWAQYQYDLASAEKSRAYDEAQANYDYAISLAGYDQTLANDTATFDESLATDQANSAADRDIAIAKAKGQFATDEANARHKFEDDLIDLGKSNTDNVSTKTKSSGKDRNTFERDQQKTMVGKESDFEREAVKAAHDYNDTAIDAWVAYAKSDPPDDQTYASTMEQAAQTYANRMQTALATLRNAVADDIQARDNFYGKPDQQPTPPKNPAGRLAGTGPSEKTLADKIKQATTKLVTAVADADRGYAKSLAYDNESYDKTLAGSQWKHDSDAKAAERDQKVHLSAASSTFRENTSAARQNYETELYHQHYVTLNTAAQSCSASSATCALTTYQAAVAWQDWQQAASRASAEQQYQQDLTKAAADYLDSVVNHAEIDLSDRTLQADLDYAKNVAASARQAAVDTADAEHDLAAASGTADALDAWSLAYARADLADAEAKAWDTLQRALQKAQEDFAKKLGQTQHNNFLNNTASWNTSIPGYFGGFGPWGWFGGAGGLGLGGFGSGYYASWGIWGGYVYGPWDLATDTDLGWGYGYGLTPGAGPLALGSAWDYYGWALGLGGFGSGLGGGGASGGGNAGLSGGASQQDQDALAAAQRQAHQDYDVALAEARITYITATGQASVDLASAKANAAVIYQSGLATAASDGDTTAADKSRRQAINPEQVNYARKVQKADAQRSTDEKNAKVNAVNQEGIDAVTAAGNRATAEWSYQHAAVAAEVSALSGVANGAGATGQQIFDWQRESALVGWIDAVKPAFVQHAKDVAEAQKHYRPYILAKNPPPVEQDPSSDPDWVNSELSREDTDANWEAYYAGSALAHELARSGSHAGDAGRLAVAEAKAARQLAIADAQDDKQYQIDLFNEQGGASASNLSTWDASQSQAVKDHNENLAQNTLDDTTSTQDATLQFQKDETNSRKNYSSALAGAQKSRDGSLASAAKNAALKEAGYQATADRVIAAGQETDWRTQTSIDNTVALAVAKADVSLWTAQESANISATQALDTAYSLPWTHFLVAQAQAHSNWWSGSGASRYLQWITDENTAQKNYTNDLNADHNVKMEGSQALGVVGVDQAKKNYAVALVNGAYTRDTDEAQARYDEIDSLVQPTKDYLDSVAQAEHDHEIALVKASYDRTVHENDPNYSGDPEADYESAIEQADSDFESDTEQYEQTWQSADAPAVSTWYASFATEEHDAAGAWITAEVTRVGADAAAEDWYAHVADSEMVAVTSVRDGLSQAFAHDEADGWVSALGSLSTASPSPWATYAAAEQTHWRDDYLIPADNAQGTLDDSTSQAEQSELDTEADDEAQGEIDSASDWSTDEGSDADTAFSTETAQAPVIGTEAANQLPQLAALPTFAAPTDAGDYSSSTAACGTTVQGFCSTFGSFGSFVSFGASGLGLSQGLLGTVNNGTAAQAESIIESTKAAPADPGAPTDLVASPESAAANGPAVSSDAADGVETADGASNYHNPQAERERELVTKVQNALTHQITISDVGNFLLGIKDGLGQGIQDGLPGMIVGAARFAVRAQSFLNQLNPITRAVGWVITGRDLGADEQAAVAKFGKDAWEVIKKSPDAAVKVARLVKEIDDFIKQQEVEFVKSLVDGTADEYFDSKIARLSPLTQQALQTARVALVELAHAGLDNLDARTFGSIVGQVIYEVAEDAVVAAALGLAEAATAGAATPAIGAEIAAKAAKLTRIVNRLSKVPGFNMPLVAKALNKLQDVIHWMKTYPICFVAGTPVHTADGLRSIEDIRPGDLVLSRCATSPDAEPRFRRVLSTVTTIPTRLYHLRLAISGTKEFETLSCTGEHPFYVPDRRAFIPAKKLAQGDQLSLADGQIALVAEIEIEDAARQQAFTTYNFEVEEDHTYFVGKAGAWVHNEGTPCGKAFQIFVKAKDEGLTDVKALDRAHEFLRRASNVDSDFLNHVDDAEGLIRNWLATALKNDYPELDDGIARYIGRKKWLAGKTFANDADDVADAVAEGLRVVTPQQLAGIERHHLLPKEFAARFRSVDIDIEDFVVAIDAEIHRLGPNALHSKDLEAWIGNWNTNWETFFDGRDRTRMEILEHLSEMVEKYSLEY